MSDQREHYGPTPFGDYILEAWKQTGTDFFHVKHGGADFLVHGDIVQDAIVAYMEKGPPKVRANSTGTTAAPALKAAMLEAAREWEQFDSALPSRRG